MAGVSPTGSFSADSAPSIETIKDLQEQCISNLDLLCSDPACDSKQWAEQLTSLRDWGESLAPSSPGASSTFLNHLRENGPLRDVIRNHLRALLAILRQANGQEDADTPKSFKIAGRDILTSPSSKQEDDGARSVSHQYSVISRCISELHAFRQSPTRPTNMDQLRPPTHRSISSIEDAKDGSDLSSAASISPLVGTGKQPRRVSGPSSAGEQTPLQHHVSPGTEGLTRQFQAMPGSTQQQRLSPQSATETTLPPLSQTLPPAPPPHPASASRIRSPYETSQYPPPQPQAPPTHPYHGPGLPPPQQATFSQYPPPPQPPGNYPPPPGPAEKRPPKRPPSMTGPSASEQPPTARVMPAAPHRLLIPNQQSEEPGSAPAVTPSPKLTKTGRVSKALRGEPVHACNICDKVYTRAEHLRRHRSNHRVNLLRSAPAGPSGA